MPGYVGVSAVVALVGVLVSFTTLVVLHGLRPELDPSWRMISEYGYGRYGWVMSLCFFGLALASLALAAALVPQTQGLIGWLGLLFLLAASVGLAMAAIYPGDPITTPSEEMSRAGQLHGTAAMIGIPSLPIAALLISLTISVSLPWPGRTTLLTLALFTCATLALMLVIVWLILPRFGGFGPEVPIGWPNRLYMFGNYLWISAAAFALLGEARQLS